MNLDDGLFDLLEVQVKVAAGLVAETGRGQEAGSRIVHGVAGASEGVGAKLLGQSGPALTAACMLLCALTTASLAGCGPEEPVMVVRTADPSRHAIGSFGLVTLMQVPHEEADNPCLRLSGQFVHYFNLHPEAVVRAVDPEISRLPNEGVVGTCRELPAGPTTDTWEPGEAADGSSTQPGSSFSIELLDAGNLTVLGPEGALEVRPRAFPDLLTSVGGVVYGSQAGQCLPVSAEGEVSLEATGGPDVGSFTVSLPVSSPPRLLSVGGLPLDEEPAPLHRSADGGLELTWEQGWTAEDQLHVELESGTWRLHCLVPNTGQFTIAETDLVNMPSGDLVRLKVRHIQVQPFLAPGIREGELVTVLQDEVLLQDQER